MAIARYENVDVNTLTFGTNSYGENVTTITKKFTSRALVSSVKNSLQITGDTRIYQDLINFKFNYTPWTQDIIINQNLYSFTWRGQDWRVTNAIETDDKMNVIILCYRNDPTTKV
ncbi:hypothetical protein EB001_07585 [bacterium]|nr:hypothetical protein [bacterium]